MEYLIQTIKDRMLEVEQMPDNYIRHKAEGFNNGLAEAIKILSAPPQPSGEGQPDSGAATGEDYNRLIAEYEKVVNHLDQIKILCHDAEYVPVEMIDEILKHKQ